MRKGLFAALALALLFVAGHAADAPKQEDSFDILSKLVNAPSATSWTAIGLPAGAVEMKDDRVQAGVAMRFAVPGKGTNPWDVAAGVLINKSIKAGDVILVAFWARAEVPAEGRQTGILSSIRFQESGPPYTGMFEDTANVTGAWQMVYASGILGKDYKPGAVGLSVQLAVAKQTIDLGPAFIVDLGPDYDRSKLPHNRLASAAGATPKPPVSLAGAEARFAGALAKLRAQLPVRATLIADPAALTVYGQEQQNQTIAVPEVPGGQAVRVTIAKPGSDPWSDVANVAVAADVRRGDMIFMAAYVRAAEVTNEAQSGVISALRVQLNHEPWTSIGDTSAMVPHDEWRVLYASGIAEIDIPQGDGIAQLQFGCCKQTLDIGPIFVFNLGPGVKPSSLPATRLTYPGREANAPWRAAAEARIRQIRMGELRVVVTDASGKPVPGATVHFAMQRHLFRFGGFAGHNIANDASPEGDKTRAVFLSTFNFGTSPIYWHDWGWENPDWRRNYIASMRWFHDNDLSWRGHPIIYPSENSVPTYIKKLSGDHDAVSRAILDHVREVASVGAQYDPCCFDLINEPRDGYAYISAISSEQTIIDAFKTAHQAAPNAHLFVNEYGIISGGGMNERYLAFYHQWIENMLARGAPLGGIGIQGHFGAQLTDPARVVAIFDDFARHHLPIEITEFDVDTPDEDAQADFTRDMLTAAFSHPSVDAFVTWDWHGTSNRTMFRPDWSEKPNARAWKKLIYHDWWTDETRDAGMDGSAGVRAFFGDYKITVTSGGRTVKRNVSFGPETGTVSVELR